MCLEIGTPTELNEWNKHLIASIVCWEDANIFQKGEGRKGQRIRGQEVKLRSVQGQSPGRGSEDEVPHKLKHNVVYCTSVNKFNVLYKKNRINGDWQSWNCILCIHTIQKIENVMVGLTPILPLGTAFNIDYDFNMLSRNRKRNRCAYAAS